jgi:hypothetical protein
MSVKASTTHGLGGWSFGFYHLGMAVPNDRVAAGVKAFKQALIDNGHGAGIDITLPVFGSNASKRTKDFQRAVAITADGVIGPQTSRYLMRLYSFAEEATGTIEIPDHLLQKVGGEESDHDPVAQGYDDPQDEGWAQLHMPYFPGLTVQQAWQPPVAVQKLGSKLKTFYVDDRADWDGAVASWNVGTETAVEWVDAGKPASLVINGFDWGARATEYVGLVKAQPA